jgi:predicted TIM-barrel fold metal-dependent hydrolase
MTSQTSRSAAIRARLDHPVIDADGHTIEFMPALLDYLREVAGSAVVDRYVAWQDENEMANWYRLSWEERHDTRTARPTWWALPARNTRDRATAALPKLLYERLDEFGFDFTVIYPSFGLFHPEFDDEELRRAACRASNTFHADIFRDYADRITPVAIIPMHTPQEAIEELEYAVNHLGLKAAMIPPLVRRPIAAVARRNPEAARDAVWADMFGLDSEHDYGPFWARCIELKVALATHSVGLGLGTRRSISSYVYNHIGNFAAKSEALCKSLFMGGVTRRFPSLKVAFLEGGIGWACSLFADLLGHWEKRNRKAIEHYDPANINREMLVNLFAQYGGKMVEGKLGQVGNLGPYAAHPENYANADEWVRCEIERAEDIRELFVPHFYFGCEADDPINTWAYNAAVNPFGARLNIMLGSDIGHWDVPDMTKVLEEAYEPVERGLITEEGFRDFVFTNVATFYAGLNPDFFKGTAVEHQASKLLAAKASKMEKER